MDDADDLSQHVEQQVAAYERVRPVYSLFADILGASLTRITRELGLNAIVQVRAKEKSSFAEKAVRKRGTYPDAINQMTDLCGGRIVTECKDDIEPVLRRIRDYFVVLEAEDVLDRLGTGEFGYRSIHLIVAMKREALPDSLLGEAMAKHFKNVTDDGASAVDSLFQRRPPIGEERSDSGTTPRFRAEIQLRTLLQHAWSVIGHDRIYKSEFAVPEKWRRDANRIAAYLEEADEGFARIVSGVESYRGDLGAYMTTEQRKQELRRLSAVATLDRQNPVLALRIARLALSLQDWQGAREILTPFVAQWLAERGTNANSLGEKCESGTSVPTLEQRVKSAVLLSFGLALAGVKRTDGRDYIAWASWVDPTNTDALVALGEASLEVADFVTAAGAFEDAYRIAPDEPRVLTRHVCAKLVSSASLDALTLIVSNLEAAVLRSRERIELKLGLPGSYFDCGMLLLLLRRPVDALKAYIRGASLSASKDLGRECLVLDLIQAHAGSELLGLEWARRVLALAMALRLNGQNAPAKTDGVASETEGQANESPLRRFQSKDLPKAASAVVIVAGATASTNESRIRGYTSLLGTAFEGYSGMIVSGGTTAGIAGMVGDLVATNVQPGGLLAWLPVSLPAGAEIHMAYMIHRVPGAVFSPLDPIQAWIDLLASGLDPARVKVLGMGGGAIASIEYRLALMLGASVGIVTGSGGSGTELLDDHDWSSAPGLLALPPDPRLLNLFVRGIPVASTLQEGDRDAMACAAHEFYRGKQMQRHSSCDPAMADWSQLSENLRASNRDQIDCIEAHLALIGLRPVKEDSGTAAVPFESDQIERMAENEHARWCLERIRSGWRHGKRDVQARKTPYLVPWSELPESIRERDRQAVSAIPEMLQRYGYCIVSNDAR